jgi:hypothetical protein
MVKLIIVSALTSVCEGSASAIRCLERAISHIESEVCATDFTTERLNHRREALEARAAIVAVRASGDSSPTSAHP